MNLPFGDLRVETVEVPVTLPAGLFIFSLHVFSHSFLSFDIGIGRSTSFRAIPLFRALADARFLPNVAGICYVEHAE